MAYRAGADIVNKEFVCASHYMQSEIINQKDKSSEYKLQV